MTSPKGNSKFCFPETLKVPSALSWGLVSLGEAKLTVFLGASHLVFCYIYLKVPDASWYTNLPWFQGAWPDNMRVERSSRYFPRELVSFVHPS